MLFKAGFAPSDVIQGRLKDCWLLGSLAIAAAKPNLLQSLVRFSWVEKGLHAVRFFVEGSWVTVVVDDVMLVDTHGLPVFGRCISSQATCSTTLFSLSLFKPPYSTNTCEQSIFLHVKQFTTRCRRSHTG